jgi:O-acetyl-ADP-ribose deacetylase (regulator of RNase III)
MSDSEEDCIETLKELYELNALKGVKSPKYHHNASLLNRVSLWQGDITTLEIDSIVNAANSHLGDGSGVNGAIQRAAGPELLEECYTLGGCETGFAKITKGYDLPAKHVIHAVGPIYSRRTVETSAAQLRSCYSVSLEIAAQNDLKHIAFPSLSTGVFGYPVEDATHIALDAARRFLDTPEGNKLELVIFVVWSDHDREVYRHLIPYYFPIEGGPIQEETTQDEEIQDEKIQDEVTQDKPTQDERTQDKPTEEEPTENRLAEEKPTENRPAGEEPTKSRPAQGEPGQDKPSEDVPTQDTPPEGDPVEA